MLSKRMGQGQCLLEEQRKMNVKIIVAAHKLYEMPEDTLYLPVHVGSAGKARFRISRMIQGIIFPRKTQATAS